MADRGILFSAPMVRALLDGRKSQTRRLLKPQPPEGLDGGFLHVEGDARPRVTHGRVILKDTFPFAISDRLWVREAWHYALEYEELPGSELSGNRGLVEYDLEVKQHGSREAGRYRHARFMPRWASRLTLTVTDVRVQRLQEISEADAIAEGLIRYPMEGPAGLFVDCWHWLAGMADEETYGSAVSAYRALWNSLHDKPGERWTDNPWICAISFDVRKGNIDDHH